MCRAAASGVHELDNSAPIELTKKSDLLASTGSSNALSEVMDSFAHHKEEAVNTGLIAGSLATAALTYAFFRGNVGGVSAAIGRMLGRESENSLLLNEQVAASNLTDGFAAIESASRGTGLGLTDLGGRVSLEDAARIGGGMHGYNLPTEALLAIDRENTDLIQYQGFIDFDSLPGFRASFKSIKQEGQRNSEDILTRFRAASE
jgi:hypothetical protein